MKYIDREGIKDLPERNQYIESIHALIAKERENAREARVRYTLETPAQARREALRDMLGFPLTLEGEGIPTLEKKTLIYQDGGVRAYRMQLRTDAGLLLYGILLAPAVLKEKNALIVFQHGGWGYPEIIGGLVPPTNYRTLARDAVEDGVYVFCPQIPYWRADLIGSPYDGEKMDLALRRIGGSKAALCVYGLCSVLNYFLACPDIDEARVGMAGLSYGGMYTLLASALDERIRFALISCFFNDRGAYAFSDMVNDSQHMRFFDEEILTLLSPRPVFIETAREDEIFAFDSACTAIERYEYYRHALALGDACQFHFFDGGHAFSSDEEALRFLHTHTRA